MLMIGRMARSDKLEVKVWLHSGVATLQTAIHLLLVTYLH